MKQLAIFMTGAVLGSLVTWALVKDKYEKLAQEEIDSVKRVFSKRIAEVHEDDTCAEEDEVDEEPAEVDEYNDLIKKNRYTQYSDISTKQKNEEEDEMERMDDDKPYIISPDEFGELDGYEKITLIHYADGVLADDNDDLVENISEVVVEDYADHFGEYEDDSVFVRNDRLKCDYEILLDLGNYSDVPSVKFRNGEY